MRRRIPRGREVFFVTLALMLLIGGYGRAQAQDENPSQEQSPSQNQNQSENQTQTQTQSQNQNQSPSPVEKATQEFLGMKFGAGVGVMGGFGGGAAVEKVSVVGTDKLVRVDEEGDLRPQVFLEMHTFMWGDKAKCWREYQQTMGAWRSGEIPVKEANTKCPNWTADQIAGTQAPPMPDSPLMGFGPFVALQSSNDTAIDALAVGLMMGRRFGTEGTNSLNIGIGFSFDPSVQVLGDGVQEGKALPPGESSVRLKKESQFGWALMISFSFL